MTFFRMSACRNSNVKRFPSYKASKTPKNAILLTLSMKKTHLPHVLKIQILAVIKFDQDLHSVKISASQHLSLCFRLFRSAFFTFYMITREPGHKSKKWLLVHCEQSFRRLPENFSRTGQAVTRKSLFAQTKFFVPYRIIR